MSALAMSCQDIDHLDEAVKQLRISYERYFTGQERIEPKKEREAVKKELRRLLADDNKNTARRYRLQSLQATIITYEQYWNRLCRQIEEGTFLRDKKRAERLLATRDEAPAPPTREHDETRRVYEDFVKLRQSLGDQSQVPYEAFADSLAKQAELARTRLRCQEVVFKAAIKDGRVVLKARPR